MPGSVRFVDHLTLVGRLAPEPGRSHYRVPDGVGFVGLPHYAQLSRPWTAVGAMARSLRRFWRLLGEVDVVWLLGPHPLALAVRGRARRCGAGAWCSASARTSPATCARAIRATAASSAAALLLEGVLARSGPASTRSWRSGRISPAAIGGARFCR